jgi:DNA-binding IclR family transcriptional regulator
MVSLPVSRKSVPGSRSRGDIVGVTALARGLAILRCFTTDRPELGTTEIARLTGLPQSTVWRLSRTLMTEGCLIAGDRADRLRIGPGALLLGHSALTRAGIADVALPMLREVALRFEASVSIAQPLNQSMVIIQRAEAPNILRVDLHVGSALPMVNSSVGLSYLAALPEDERRARIRGLEREQARSDPEAWSRLARGIDEALAQYRRSGHVFNLGRSHRDINAVGLPILAPNGRPALAITCGAARSRMNREMLSREVSPKLKAIAVALAPLVPAALARGPGG